jgi:hypothetical protein
MRTRIATRLPTGYDSGARFAIPFPRYLALKLPNIRLLIPVLAIALTATAACGSGDATAAHRESFEKITPSERIFSIDDFKAVRFKTNTEYDVSELPAATDAWFGFWTPSGTVSKEYEIRFYGSHAEAKTFGTSYAIEGSGETALLDEEDATWDEGLKDRKAYFAAPSSHGSGSVQALYGGYAIYANMVLLCEGANEEHALGHCAALMTAVDPQVIE